MDTDRPEETPRITHYPNGIDVEVYRHEATVHRYGRYLKGYYCTPHAGSLAHAYVAGLLDTGAQVMSEAGSAS